METKKWYKSRTVWAGILTVGFSLARAFEMLPATFTDSMTDELVQTILGIVTVYFRLDTTAVTTK